MPLVWIAWLLLVSGQSPVEGAVDEVRCAETRFSESAERRDRDAFASFLDPDARFVTDRVSRGPAEVLEAWAPFFAPDGPRIRWRPETVEVTEDGSLALSRGPYRVLAPGPDGRTVERWGTFISTWRRGPDGAWRVLFDTGGDAGMEPSEAQRSLLESPTPEDCRTN